jgi:hypothetical protein
MRGRTTITQGRAMFAVTKILRGVELLKPL